MSTGRFTDGAIFVLLMVILIVSNITVIIVSAISGNWLLFMLGIGFSVGSVAGWLMKKYKNWVMD